MECLCLLVTRYSRSRSQGALGHWLQGRGKDRAALWQPVWVAFWIKYVVYQLFQRPKGESKYSNFEKWYAGSYFLSSALDPPSPWKNPGTPSSDGLSPGHRGSDGLVGSLSSRASAPPSSWWDPRCELSTVITKGKIRVHAWCVPKAAARTITTIYWALVFTRLSSLHGALKSLRLRKNPTRGMCDPHAHYRRGGESSAISHLP